MTFAQVSIGGAAIVVAVCSVVCFVDKFGKSFKDFISAASSIVSSVKNDKNKSGKSESVPQKDKGTSESEEELPEGLKEKNIKGVNK